MLDWLRKEFISEYVYSNIDEDRECVKSVRINGRLYDKYGVDCATTAVALKYKVPVPGVKQFKICYLVGIARQNPCDTIISKTTGYEIAKENAMINPIMTLEYNQEPQDNIIKMILQAYILGLPCQMIKTSQEIKSEGKDITIYNRQRHTNDYYNRYYKDFKEKFL